jgi:hypothetical protein
MGKES